MTPLVEVLTDREEQVLLLLADGHGLREIGARLGISHLTARDHRDRARHKLGAGTTTQAVAMIIRRRSKALRT